MNSGYKLDTGESLNKCDSFVHSSGLSLFIDRVKGDDAGARERDPEGADSDPSGRGAIITTYVAQATRPGDTID